MGRCVQKYRSELFPGEAGDVHLEDHLRGGLLAQGIELGGIFLDTCCFLPMTYKLNKYF